jgi:hypothetical protein
MLRRYVRGTKCAGWPSADVTTWRVGCLDLFLLLVGHQETFFWIKRKRWKIRYGEKRICFLDFK